MAMMRGKLQPVAKKTIEMSKSAGRGPQNPNRMRRSGKPGNVRGMVMGMMKKVFKGPDETR